MSGAEGPENVTPAVSMPPMPPSSGDVSVEAFGVFWDYLAARGRDRAGVLVRMEAMGYPRESLLRPKSWHPVAALVALEHAIAAEFPNEPDLFVRIGTSIGSTTGLGFLRVVSRNLLSPEVLYRTMPRLMRKFLFRFFTLEFETVAPGHLRGSYVFREDCPPTDAFLETARGVLSAMPRMLGAPHAIVTLERTGPTTATVDILVVRWVGPWQRIRAFAGGVMRSIGLRLQAPREAAALVEVTHDMLQQRVDELERLKANLTVLVEERTSELAHARDRLQATVEELELSNRARSTFFTNVSHEFKTPLTLILAACDELEATLRELSVATRPATDEAQAAAQLRADRIAMVRRNARALLILVNEILDFARMDAGRMPLRPTSFDLAATLGQQVDELAPMADARSLELTWDGPRDGLNVTADRTLILRAAMNLIVNAIKYVRDGDRIRVTAELLGDEVEIAVQDTGPGIALDQQAHIFGRFQRSYDAEGNAVDGSGIGLAMVDEIARLHGGGLSLLSDVGAGARFALRIPRHQGPSAGTGTSDARTTAAAEAPGEHETRLQLDALGDTVLRAGRRRASDVVIQQPLEAATGPDNGRRASDDGALSPRRPSQPVGEPAVGPVIRGTVLVVDDNDELRGWMAEVLARRHHVHVAANGVEALAVLDSTRVDVVVSDVMMPVMDGHALAATIKANPDTARIGVILVTARHGSQAVVEAFAAHADDFIAKPFSSDELLVRVQTQMRLRRLTDQLVRSEKSQLLGSLSSGIAHEVLNPLNATLQAVRLLRDEQMHDDLSEAERVVLLETIDRASRRIQGIVQSVQRFARHDGERGPRQIVRLADQIDGLRPLVSYRLAGGVSLDVALGWDGAVACYPDLLDQALLNLVVNALDAVAGGGKVTIRSRLLTPGGPNGAPWLELRVEDDGPGVPASLASQIFEPFFTTKDPGQGTGMGLAICAEIADAHAGGLRLETPANGKGAAFVLELPLTDDATLAPTTPRSTKDPT